MYKYYEWNSNKGIANGVAIVTDSCSFVVAKEDLSSKLYLASSSDLSNNNNTMVEKDKSTALTDYDGLNNTNLLSNIYGSDASHAQGACKLFSFPNGKKGYLGSTGEWKALFDNYSMFTQCISAISGAYLIANDYYWHSTRASGYSDVRYWASRYEDNYYTGSRATEQRLIRPFTTL